MAKARLEYPFDALVGRLDKNSKLYCAHRLGEQVISTYPRRRDPKTITIRQKQLNSRFAEAVAKAKAELADPDRLQYWQKQFLAQPQPAKYKILRNFVIAQLTQSIALPDAE
ncbi:MAG: hypothetical protein ACI3Z5_01415 [Paludibacteraceae bacterium]